MANEFLDRVAAARHDELQANAMYNQMAGIAPSRELSLIVASIAEDEYNHARILATILAEEEGGWEDLEELGEELHSRATGTWWRRTAPPPQTDPARFRRMAEEAVRDELDAVCDYAVLARLSPSTEKRLILLSILGDEYGHARTLITMLSELGR